MKKLTVFRNPAEDKRITYGINLVMEELERQGYEPLFLERPEDPADYRCTPGKKIYAGILEEDEFLRWAYQEELLIFHTQAPKGEGFYLQTLPGGLTVICGGSSTGVLYGCMELLERIKESGELPEEIAFGDEPVFKLRGPAVGLQKTKIEPPRLTYEYPVTPERFPWFYEKEQWKEFLDMLLSMRCNVLYIWSGHPFSSFVKVSDYPEALEVTEEEYERNCSVFRWLTEECDRRGIWVVLKFYNIHIPLPFARAHRLELLQSSIDPLVADYTYKSIVEFIKAFPNVGLMVCLGEALRGDQNKTAWFVETILPAVKQGLLEAGIREEPPVILRGHDCNPFTAMEGAKKLYSNLFTMWKYNGESLTTYYPRGVWQERHQKLSEIKTTHIMNVHILADLEPFRFNAPLYIQKCTQAGRSRLGANGLHLYPLFYWDWPYSPDKTSERLRQMDRDYFWFAAWFRYAWNPDRDERAEKEYWIHCYTQYYDISRETAEKLFEAQEDAAQCAPRILGRVGITEGNRQTLSLGMTMSELTNVDRYRPNRELWNSVARKGEQPDDYVKKELAGEKHVGETPYDMISDVRVFAESALKKIASAVSEVCAGGGRRQELFRIKTDIHAICLMSLSYCKKVEAAMKILLYKYTMDEKCQGDFKLLEEAAELMKESQDYYRELADLTQDTYLYANSMQTRQRKIPFTDGDAYGHWTQCLPEYEKEYMSFVRNLDGLKNGVLPRAESEEEIVPLQPSGFTLLSEECETYKIEKGECIFKDSHGQIQKAAPELSNLTGIRMDLGDAMNGGVHIKIRFEEDSYLLVGYMQTGGVEWLKLPDLETNTHADDRGGLAAVYRNAVKTKGCPVVEIHAYQYEKGEHDIYFGNGGYMIAGVVSQQTVLAPRNADLGGEGLETLDWMYGQ
ncbi:hypothetical protein [Murimonas intestini]|uniref:hypothetical protein n=1 Tax=Murimonas intestini TaxID=1337051 RepID=UPI0011DD2E23|nr:hypothetical protein [Murimonas intestini]